MYNLYYCTLLWTAAATAVASSCDLSVSVPVAGLLVPAQQQGHRLLALQLGGIYIFLKYYLVFPGFFKTSLVHFLIYAMHALLVIVK